MERLTSKFADYTQAEGNWVKSEYTAQLQRYENLMEQYNIPDLPALETLLKANAEGLVVVLPAAKGSEFLIEGCMDYPVVFEDVGIWIQAIEEGEWHTLDEINFDIGAGIYLTHQEAEAALEKEKSNATE